MARKTVPIVFHLETLVRDGTGRNRTGKDSFEWCLITSLWNKFCILLIQGQTWDGQATGRTAWQLWTRWCWNWEEIKTRIEENQSPSEGCTGSYWITGMLAFLLSAAQSINNSVPTHGSSGRPLVCKRIGIQEEGNPSRDTPIKKPLGAGSFMRCRVLHLNPTERNTHLAIPVPFVCEYVLCGNMCCHLVVMFSEIMEIAYYRLFIFRHRRSLKRKISWRLWRTRSVRGRELKKFTSLQLYFFSLSNVFIGAEKCLLYFCSLKTQNLPPSPRWKGKRSWKKM